MTFDSIQPVRKIIHIDMDCFYAAIEERDHPQYRGKPLAVGGAANRRGVLCTCNYPAHYGAIIKIYYKLNKMN
jgi:DNA polymerase IV